MVLAQEKTDGPRNTLRKSEKKVTLITEQRSDF